MASCHIQAIPLSSFLSPLPLWQGEWERESTSIRTNQNWLWAGPKKVAKEGAIKSFPTASLPRKQTESEATEIGKSRDASPPRLLSALVSGGNLACCRTLNTLSTLPFIPVEMLWAGGKAFL